MMICMNGLEEEVEVVRQRVGYHANLVKTTKREQNPVVVKMLLRELSKDAGLLALRVKRIKEGEGEMAWKDILKAPLNEREMAEAREFMPEEMGRRSVQAFLPITRDNEMADLIKLGKDNMDKFDKDEKERVNFFINSLENKYDENTVTALRLEIGKLYRKGLLRVGKVD